MSNMTINIYTRQDTSSIAHAKPAQWFTWWPVKNLGLSRFL